MKKLLFLCLAAVLLPASAARLTIAVTTTLDGQTLADLSAAAARLDSIVPTRLVVRGIPLRDGWSRDAYWTADEAAKAALKSELQSAWTEFARSLPAAGVEIDPAFFRRHQLETVPAFVLEMGRLEGEPASCDAASPAAPDDVIIIRGNVTAGWALEAMRREAAQGRGVAPETKALLDKMTEAGLW